MFKKLKIDLYSTGVIFFAEKNLEEANKILRKIGCNGTVPRFAEGCCFHEKGYWPIIWVKNKNDIPVLCHEVTHACFSIFDTKGITVENQNHEALTYLQTYILKEILRKK